MYNLSIITGNSKPLSINNVLKNNEQPVDNRCINGMAKMEDLITCLSKRNWINDYRVYHDGNLKLSLENYDSIIPVIKTENHIDLIENINQTETDYIINIYNELIEETKTMMNLEIDLENKCYNEIKTTRDFIKEVSMVDLFTLTNTKNNYINTLNLDILDNLEDSYKDINYTIKLGVSYVKSGNRYNTGIIFCPFTVNNDELIYNDFTKEVNSDITIEVNNGQIKLYSDSPLVTENIIHYCFAIYEKLL